MRENTKGRLRRRTIVGSGASILYYILLLSASVFVTLSLVQLSECSQASYGWFDLVGEPVPTVVGPKSDFSLGLGVKKKLWNVWSETNSNQGAMAGYHRGGLDECIRCIEIRSTDNHLAALARNTWTDGDWRGRQINRSILILDLANHRSQHWLERLTKEFK